MDYIEEHLEHLRARKRNIVEVYMPQLRAEADSESSEDKRNEILRFMDSVQEDLMLTDDKIVEVHNVLLKIKAWDSLFAKDFNIHDFISRAEGLGVQVKIHAYDSPTGFYYFARESETYIRFGEKEEEKYYG